MADPMFDQALIQAYVDAGWWGTRSLAEVVAGHATTRPDDAAYIVADASGESVLTWTQYHERSEELAATLVQAPLEPGMRLAVLLPDGATVHTVFLAAEKAGLVVAGIGSRAGRAEVRHLLGRTGATALLTHEYLHGQPAAELVESLRADGLPGLRHVVVPDVLA
jgi:acyl-CoA synthetase